MKPTIETWSENPLQVGPIYPWVGWEVLMVVAGIVFCVAILWWKFRMETAKYVARSQQLRQGETLRKLLADPPPAKRD